MFDKINSLKDTCMYEEISNQGSKFPLLKFIKRYTCITFRYSNLTLKYLSLSHLHNAGNLDVNENHDFGPSIKLETKI